MNLDETVKYYDDNAKEYFDKSVSVDMSGACDKFLAYVPAGGTILDIGCGSGRDLKYFFEHGYKAEGLEVSASMQALAEEYSGCKVYLESVQTFIPKSKYDAIWACASLLHLTADELISFFRGMDMLLKPGGIICISMKSGIRSGKDEYGRYFENFDEKALQSILDANTNLSVIHMWDSDDNLNRNDFKWTNAIMKCC